MRILLLAFFFGIKHIFSRDTGASETDEKLRLYDSDFSPMPLDNLREQLKDRSINSNILYLSKDIQKEIFERFSENYDILKPRAETSDENSPFTDEEESLINRVLPLVSSPFTKERCVHTLTNVCKLATTYAATNEKLKSLLTEKCNNTNKTCEETFKKLEKYCPYLKSIYEKNKDFSNDFCSQHYSKCRHIKKICNNTLNDLCTTIRNECYKKPDKGRIANVHTSIVDTTVVEVETIDYTHTEVFFEKTVCCGRVHYTTCKSSEPSKPTTSLEPEEELEKELEEEDEPEEELEKELEEEDEPEESNSSTDTEECAITLTSTVTNNIGETHTTTVTVTPGAKDKINNKDDGTRIRLQKAGLVYLIVGITTGIWIIV